MLRVVLIVGMLLVAAVVDAEVYKCPDGKGGSVYRDAPCSSAAEATDSLALPATPAQPDTLAEPIDSRQYGFLNTSMTMESVRERFGAPDQIIDEKPIIVGRRMGPGTAVARTIERTTWVYKGDSTILTTVIQFRDGVVERFYKTR